MLVARGNSHNAPVHPVEIKMAAPMESTSALSVMSVKKRERKPNFTYVETQVLVDHVLEEVGVLRSKFSNEITSKMKRQKWDEIAQKVSSLGVAVRSGENCREKWNQLLSKAKEVHSLHQKHQRGTGGGGKMPKPEPTIARIIETFEKDASFEGISGGFESSVTITNSVCPPTSMALAPVPCPPMTPGAVSAKLSELSGWHPQVKQASNVICSEEAAVPLTAALATYTDGAEAQNHTDTNSFEMPPTKKKMKLCKVTGARKAQAKTLLKDAMGPQKTQQEVMNIQYKAMEATLAAQKATSVTQELLQQESTLRIEKLKLEIDLLKEKQLLSGFEM